MDLDHTHSYEIRRVEWEGSTIKILWTCYHGDETFNHWEYFAVVPPTH